MSSSSLNKWNHLLEDVSGYHQDIHLSMSQLISLAEPILMQLPQIDETTAQGQNTSLANQSASTIASLETSLQSYITLKNSYAALKDIMNTIRPRLHQGQFVRGPRSCIICLVSF